MLFRSNTDSNDEDDYESGTESNSESDNSTLTGDEDSVNSDEDEYFVRFDSTTNYDNVDYIMVGSTCYAIELDSTDSHEEDEVDEDENPDCLECQHDVLVYFINGYIDQQMMDKNSIQDICRLQGIDLSSHTVFEHLLE